MLRAQQYRTPPRVGQARGLRETESPQTRYGFATKNPVTALNKQTFQLLIAVRRAQGSRSAWETLSLWNLRSNNEMRSTLSYSIRDDLLNHNRDSNAASSLMHQNGVGQSLLRKYALLPESGSKSPSGPKFAFGELDAALSSLSE